MAKNAAFSFAIILGFPYIRLLKKPSFILPTLVFFGFLRVLLGGCMGKSNNPNLFDIVMAAIAVFALVVFLIALWKIMG